MKKLVIVLLAIVSVMGTSFSPAFADSKSQTVRVSCVVMPEMRITAPGQRFAMDSVRISSNFGERFNTSECWRMDGHQKTKLYTVTAL